jgi:hypothetical protein
LLIEKASFVVYILHVLSVRPLSVQTSERTKITVITKLVGRLNKPFSARAKDNKETFGNAHNGSSPD